MKIIGQPDNYSEILQRIFWISVTSGIICTLLIAKSSTTISDLLNLIPNETDIGWLKGLKALYVFIPLLIALISRIIKLHNRISDLLRIRYRFDTRYLLFPLAERSGIKLTNILQKKIQCNREKLMYSIFYPYASFIDPVIDKQLVRTAADHWGWFWAFIESSFLFLLTVFILVYLHSWNYVLVSLIIVIFELLFMIFLWNACRKSGKRQIEAIVVDSKRRQKIAQHFREL